MKQMNRQFWAGLQRTTDCVKTLTKEGVPGASARRRLEPQNTKGTTSPSYERLCRTSRVPPNQQELQLLRRRGHYACRPVPAKRKRLYCHPQQADSFVTAVRLICMPATQQSGPKTMQPAPGSNRCLCSYLQRPIHDTAGNFKTP